MDDIQNGRTIDFQFNGKAGEYFKIWIVNLALSIITLGIYSPWAKVRRKRYFYSNTTLDGSSFEYLADPLAILKGRMIVFAFILVYAVSTKIMPMLVFVFLIVYLIALPWMVIKSMQFNTRNSAYRNIRFNFDGKLGEAAFILIVLSIVTLLTLGLATPYFVKRFKQFTIERSSFGTTNFEFYATTWDFYKVYLKAFLIPIILIVGILAAIAIPAYQGYMEQAKMQNEAAQQLPGESINTEQADISQYEEPQQSTDTWQTDGNGKNLGPQAEPNPVAAIAAVITQILVMLLYLLLWVYAQTRIANLVLNNTTLSQHSISSTLRVRDMFVIYLTNMFGVLFSLGLLIPWAKIRLARYRLSHTSFVANGDINEFIADEQQNIAATGGEFTEAFDVDLGF